MFLQYYYATINKYIHQFIITLFTLLQHVVYMLLKGTIIKLHIAT